MSVSSQKKAHNTSFRSAAQATDSTCSGSHAKNAATNALPHRPGRAAQKNEQQQGVRHMKEQVDEVMSAGVDTEERAVGLMRDPSERMPVRLLAGLERPDRVRPVQARGDVRVGGDVLFVVVNDKRMTGDRPIKRRRSQRHHEADEREKFSPGRLAGRFRI